MLICSKQYKDGGRFCTECGSELQEMAESPIIKRVCPNCGRDILNGGKFCTNCGAPVLERQVDAVPISMPVEQNRQAAWLQRETVPYKSISVGSPTEIGKKSGFRWWLVPLMTFGVLFTVAVISAVFSLPHRQTGTFYSKQSSESAAQTVNFDLSQYDSHGKLSCGRIWVTKTEASWDSSPKKYYAYLDIDGNVVYGWNEIGEVWGGDIEYPGYIDSCIPNDFHNNYAVIINRTFENKRAFIDVIDVNGQNLFNEKSAFVSWEKTGRSNGVPQFRYWYTDFDENGIFYFIGQVWWDKNTEGDRGFYFVDATGIHQFKAKLNLHESLLNTVEKIGDYFFIRQGIYTSLFDSQGEPVLNFREKADIEPYKIELLDNRQIRAYFLGKDGKDYQCILDFDGNFLTEPTLN